MGPTSSVRASQMALLERRSSTSSSVSGKVSTNSARPSSQPAGRSAIIPPTRLTEVVRRAPQ